MARKLSDKQAMELFENGEAVGVLTTVLLMRSDSHDYISFDGTEFEEIDSKLVKKQF